MKTKTKLKRIIKEPTVELEATIPTPIVRNGVPIKGKVAMRCLVLYPPGHGGKKVQYIYDPPEGRIFTYRNKLCLLLIEKGGKLEPYNPYGKEIGMPAAKLSRCKQCLPAQRLLRSLNGFLEKLALGAIVVAIGIGAFLMIVIMGEI